MAYDLNKRLSELQDKLHKSQYYTVGAWKAFFAATLIFALVIFALKPPYSTPPHNSQQIWLQTMHQQINGRLNLLSIYPFSSVLKDTYYSLAKSCVISFNLPSRYMYNTPKNFDPFRETLDLSGFEPQGWSNFFTELVLRLVFVFMALLPIWILAAILGFISIRFLKHDKLFDPILTTCDRKQTPFYSGIFGDLKINGKVSGIEAASVGLACPGMVKHADAMPHRITGTLRQFDAFCATTLDLTRIILEYKDFPCHVDEERPVDSDQNDHNSEKADNISSLGIIGNNGGTIENNTEEILPSLLLAHKTLKTYFKHYEKDFRKAAQSDDDIYLQFKEQLKTFAEGQPELSLTIMNLLTPKRAQAFAKLSPKEVATAYLAIEAGKCLVYKRSDKVYLKISQFPHLQARAVLHSIRPYSSEFNADSRLIIRQAIICSRRHRDFGRSFLPEKMPEEGKALRDILEVLYADKEHIKDLSLITELDAHLDEILHNWQNNFFDSVKNNTANSDIFNPDPGIVHRSLVLLKQEKILELSLRGYAKPRLERIHRLMKHARKFSDGLSISARLPGFKRQLESEQEITDERNKSHNWDLVKKMLTRYNWLSTRVDDDAVPKSGLLYGLVVDRKADHADIFEFETLVPLRQRRMKELLGSNWERRYYQTHIHPNDIFVFADKDDYETKLKRWHDSMKK